MKKLNIFVASLALCAFTAAIAIPVYASTGAFSPQRGGHARALMGRNFKKGVPLTQEQKDALKQKSEIMKKQHEANMAKMQAAEKAIEVGDYNAWLAAVGKDCPMAKKINKDNFPKLVEIHNLEKQIQEKRKELGIEKGNFGEFGYGRIK